MSKDPTGPLSTENVDWQFCSDWLKDEIKRVLTERDRLEADAHALREALLRCHEGLQAIQADTWIEGIKWQGEFKGKAVNEIAEQIIAETFKAFHPHPGRDLAAVLAAGEGLAEAYAKAGETLTTCVKWDEETIRAILLPVTQALDEFQRSKEGGK
jgi:hypothetical protein